MKKKWFWLLAAALFIYTVKSIFVGADIDEAYGVTLGYRMVQGDRLMWDMWEPHQTSAVFTAAFIRLILLFTGGSLQYMTVFLRVCFFVVQAGITLYIYRCLRDCLPYLTDDERILFGMIYYITTPKCNYVPEYSNLHVWFSTLLAFFLMQYFSRASKNYGKNRYLALAGAMLACDVLAYPSMVIFYPICMGVILWKTGGGRNVAQAEVDKHGQGEEDETPGRGTIGRRETIDRQEAADRQDEMPGRGTTDRAATADRRATIDSRETIDRQEAADRQATADRHKPARKLADRRWLAGIVFTAPCALGAAAFLGYIFSYMSLRDIQMVLPCILVDGSHKMGLAKRLGIWGSGLLELALIMVGCAVAAAGIVCLQHVLRGKKGQKGQKEALVDFLFWWFLAQTIYQIIYWMDTEYNSGYPQVAYIAVALFGLYCRHKSGAKSRTGFYLIGLSLLNFVGLNLFSNWKPTSLTVYLVLGLLGGLLCWRQYFWEKRGATGLNLFQIICVVFLLSEVFGRCLLVIGSEEGNNMIFQVRGISREGVRGGILMSYMNAYRYNNNYEFFPEIVPKGSNVLYLGPSQFYYMMGECRVAAPSTISTPEYDEHLKLYYELHPERFPDVVVVESTYGDVSYFSEDDYIYTWLEEDFAPYETEDYPYVQVYRRTW